MAQIIDDNHPYASAIKTLTVDGRQYKYFDLCPLSKQYEKLPFSIRVLLEAAVRKCDNFQVKTSDVNDILNWHESHKMDVEIPFIPSRVILQDFTGVPAVVDFAAMRDAVKSLGGDPEKINPICPADLVIDHSVQVDVARSVLRFAPNPGGGAGPGNASVAGGGASPGNGSSGVGGLDGARCSQCERNQKCLKEPGTRSAISCPYHQRPLHGTDALEKNEELEFVRNKERFQFLKWGARAFKNLLIVPPGSGIVHQVNLEYLARVVMEEDGYLFPDSLVGTDSHTTMINGLGVLGWGVGGIEAEAVMLGQSISMVLPPVIGYKITGQVTPLVTSTDVVLTITKHLRSVGVVGKFVEFFGEGVSQLSIADRATISNMCPEYGATVGYFPIDVKSLEYLIQTGREESRVGYIKDYLHACKLIRDYSNPEHDPVFSQVVELDLASVVSCCSGPKRPHDKIPASDMNIDFDQCMTSKTGFKGFGVTEADRTKSVNVVVNGVETRLDQGSVVIAAITSCTNTSNPSVMLAAGLLAKKAVEAGLTIKPYVRTSLSPGSGVVTYYLKESGVLPYLEQLGFNVVGYGCMTCIGNSGPLDDTVAAAIEKNDLVACSVLSGNRNFEGRVHPLTKANYLCSPPLVVVYALAGTVRLDITRDPVGTGKDGKPVYLTDLWPSREEIQETENRCVIPAMFREVYQKIQTGNDTWNKLAVPEGDLYAWDPESTYIKSPPFFEGMTKDLPEVGAVEKAYCLLNVGDSVTTDHISPAGSIARNSPAARYLGDRGLTPREFNSYGSRRGNDAVMSRGTFANIRLVNKLISKPGPRTLHIPSGETMDVFDAAQRYKEDGHTVIVLAGKEYGSGSSRDWAAKGPWILGIRAVIAESYERIHRSNLIGMGILPLQYLRDQSATTLGLTGHERYTIHLPQQLSPGHTVRITTECGKEFESIVRFDTEVELTYYRHGGILQYMIRRML